MSMLSCEFFFIKEVNTTKISVNCIDSDFSVHEEIMKLFQEQEINITTKGKITHMGI